MYPGHHSDPRLGGYQSFGGFTNRHTGAVIHQGAPGPIVHGAAGTITRGPISHAPLDARLGAPLTGPPLAGAYATGPHHQQISQNAPGYHNEYPVTTIEHEPVTRIETIPVTKSIQVPVTHMESKEVSETIQVPATHMETRTETRTEMVPVTIMKD